MSACDTDIEDTSAIWPADSDTPAIGKEDHTNNAEKTTASSFSESRRMEL